MKFIIIMLIAMIVGGTIGAYVDDKLLRSILTGLLVSLALSIYFNKRKKNLPQSGAVLEKRCASIEYTLE